MAKNDVAPAPLTRQGWFYQLFKEDYEKILDELNEMLVA